MTPPRRPIGGGGGKPGGRSPHVGRPSTKGGTSRGSTGGASPARRGTGGRGSRQRGGAAPADTRRRHGDAPGPAGASRRGADRHGVGGEQVEGRQAVRELLGAGRRSVREVWIADGLDPSAQLDDIERFAARRRVRVVSVSKRRLDTAARTDAPQGVVAFAEPIEEVALDDVSRTVGGKPPFLLVLDGVTDPHNVGSLLRTAECAGVTGIVLPRHRAAHVTPTVAKVAAGAIEHLPIAVVPGVPAALRLMRSLGIHTVGLHGDADRSLYDLGRAAAGPVALVMGAEGRGLAELTRRRCDVLVGIPQRGSIASLNVAAAGAVACFELARRRFDPGGPQMEPVVGLEPTT